MARTLLHLVRHGEQEPVALHTAGSGLSALGREQSQRLGHRLGGGELLAGPVSPLARAVETADVLARHLTQVPRHTCDDVTGRTPIPSAGERHLYPERWLPWLGRGARRGAGRGCLGPRRRGPAARYAERDRSASRFINDTFVIGWFVRHVLDAPVWPRAGLDRDNCAMSVQQFGTDQSRRLVASLGTGHL